MLLPIKNGITYGPVRSRRLGRSLGVNVLQSLFADGESGNLAPCEVEAWIERVAAIRPRTVQITTLDRESPCHLISRAAREPLEEIQARLEARGVPSEVFS